jgi:guanylate kinase
MKYIIYGHSLAGKTRLQKRLRGMGFTAVVSHTTRRKRKGEVNGNDYFFVEPAEFAIMSVKGDFMETATHQDTDGEEYCYGMTHEQWDKSDIVVLNAPGVMNIPVSKLSRLVTIKMTCDREEALSRLEKRGMPAEGGVEGMWARIDREEKEILKLEDKYPFVPSITISCRKGLTTVRFKQAVFVSVAQMFKGIYNIRL